MSTSADAVKAAALQAQLHDAAAAREAAEARAVALQEELAATEVRLQQAAARGTPRGEGAKVVLQKSFARIRQLQGQLAEAHAAMGEAAALREGLAEAQERVRDLEAHMHAEVWEGVGGCMCLRDRVYGFYCVVVSVGVLKKGVCHHRVYAMIIHVHTVVYRARGTSRCGAGSSTAGTAHGVHAA